jgi:hypothetical protein
VTTTDVELGQMYEGNPKNTGVKSQPEIIEEEATKKPIIMDKIDEDQAIATLVRQA